MKPLVIYHANCADGFCAAWVAHLKLGDAEFYPANYGDPLPTVARRTVYILDFSYPYETVLAIAKVADFVTLLDHHKTAAAELVGKVYPDNVNIIVNEHYSGGQLAWAYLNTVPEPWLVSYTADRDLWKWVLPKSREVSAALSSHPFDFELWDRFAQGGAEDLAYDGEAILRYQAQLIAQQVASATMSSVLGYNVPVINTRTLLSETLGELAKGRSFAAGYFEVGDKRIWSLRSASDGIDVAELAKIAGGGGHKHAAGFQQQIQVTLVDPIH